MPNVNNNSFLLGPRPEFVPKRGETKAESYHTPVTSIATSSALNDSGTFKFNFRDERYLPFELAGVISEWQLELSIDPELRPFDYSTISDVILHLNYTARENGGSFKGDATSHIKNFLENVSDLTEQPLMQMFSMRHEFPTEWHKFLYPGTVGAEQILDFTLGKKRFPFFAQDRDIVVMKIDAFAKCTQATDYKMVLSYVDSDGDTVTSPKDDPPNAGGPKVITLPQNKTFRGLNKATINANDAGLNLEELDIAKKMSLQLKRSTAADYKSLVTAPNEVKDIFFVVHYKLKGKPI